MTAGALMAADIAAQPDVIAGILRRADAVTSVAAEIAARKPRFILFAARGTSDHAALYAKYLVEIDLALPAGLASPSSVTVFDARPQLADVLLIAVSQSGGSPDLVRYTEVARRQGATTVAVTNTPASALGEAAEFALDIGAGTEAAVAATKTYTAQLTTLLLLIRGMRDGQQPVGLDELPDAVSEVLNVDVAQLAARYRFASRLVVTGRGFAFPTALEAALKVMETSYLPAQAFSGADLLHGPVAMADPGLPVIGITGPGPGGSAMTVVLDKLAERGADVVTLGPAVPGFSPNVVVPNLDERLRPIVDIVPLQLLARQVALSRGTDPDRPRGLAKLTETL